MRPLVALSLTSALALSAGLAKADPYVDYTPVKGVWHVITVKVDPNHVDDYLIGLKKSWAPGEELAKKHGMIDMYGVRVKVNAMDGHGNVLLLEHFPNIGVLEPDKARDVAMMKEAEAMQPKEKAEAQIREYDKYRTFVGDDYWTGVDFDMK